MFLTVTADAQTFQFIPNHTTVNDTLGSEMIFDFELKNISTEPQTVYILRTRDQLPTDWTSSLCFDEGCFAPFVDSVATTQDYGSSPILPGESRDFSVHVFSYGNHGTANVTVKAVNMNNTSEVYEAELTAASVLVSVEDELNITGFSLDQNYPNPFNPSTTISFSLPFSSNISLVLYNAAGKEVGVITEGYYSPGSHSVRTDLAHLSSGAYFYTLKTDKFTVTKKMILEK
ncbi:hypothetical protein MASR2M39_20620 [Ignavibacteriales bacterium]